MLARAYEARADWPKAKSELSALLAKDPKNGNLRVNLAKVMFLLLPPEGKSDNVYSELKQAYKDDREANKEEGKVETPDVYMAKFWADKGENDKARDWFEKAVKADPKYLRVLIAYADWLTQHNDFTDAKARIEAAAKVKSDASGQKQLPEIPAIGNHRVGQAVRKRQPRDHRASLLLHHERHAAEERGQQKKGKLLGEQVRKRLESNTWPCCMYWFGSDVLLAAATARPRRGAPRRSRAARHRSMRGTRRRRSRARGWRRRAGRRSRRSARSSDRRRRRRGGQRARAGGGLSIAIRTGTRSRSAARRLQPADRLLDQLEPVRGQRRQRALGLLDGPGAVGVEAQARLAGRSPRARPRHARRRRRCRP